MEADTGSHYWTEIQRRFWSSVAAAVTELRTPTSCGCIRGGGDLFAEALGVSEAAVHRRLCRAKKADVDTYAEGKVDFDKFREKVRSILELPAA